MIKTTKHKSKVQLHDTKSNHVWFFDIDFIKPEINVSKNGEFKATFNAIQIPVSTDFLMELTKGL